ncbi:MAG: RsiV family protein [Bacteroidota bacterium]|jgi:hypothetical protein
MKNTIKPLDRINWGRIVRALKVFFIIFCSNYLLATGNGDSFYKKFSGKIGNSSIVLDLKLKSKTISGSYYYKKIGIPILISGEINSDQSFVFSERDKNGNVTGTFKGKFVSDTSALGKWSDVKNNKSFDFTLSLMTKNIAAVFYELKRAENCLAANKNKQNFNNEMTTWDTSCTKVELDFIIVNTSNAEISKRINKSIMETFCGKRDDGSFNTIDDLLKSVNDIGDDANAGFESAQSCDVSFNENNILCVDFSDYSYYFGAAHPNGLMTHLNFDLKSGKVITLNDILVPNFKNALNQIGKKNLYKDYGSEGWDFPKGKFELNNNFSIGSSGLTFQFNPYEIGPYSAGAPAVFISYSELKTLLKSDGLLKSYIKK